MAQLRILSLNCHGLNVGCRSYLRDVLNGFDVVLLQETWLSEGNCSVLSDLSSDFIYFHSSSMEGRLTAGIFTGRPFGGTAVMVRKCFAHKVSRVVSNSPRVTAVHFLVIEMNQIF